MHIPDGFVSPRIYLPAYVLAGGLWAWSVPRLRVRLRGATIPRLAVMTALSFVLMMILIPLPGGTSVHASGIGLLAICFGSWCAFMAISLVLAMQAFLFAVGGITTLPINALALGGLGAAAAVGMFRVLRPWNEAAALVTAGWMATMLPAGATAVVLGIQPHLAHAADGSPLYFPFGLAVTLPAILLPHALVGIGEGILTLLVYRLLARTQPEMIAS